MQTRFRQKLVDAWRILPGTAILEVGCGQGDMTLVLAAATGPDGHVTAIDAADETSGSPLTFAKATARIRRSRVGKAVSFRFGVDVLEPEVDLPRPHYDCAVLAHSLWYFASMDLLQRTLKRMKELADRLYLSEWDLTPTRKSQLPHFAAALVQGWTSAWKPDRRCNIQTLMSRQAIERLVLDAGWTIETNVSVDSSDLQDGRWEVLNCLQILSSGIGRDDSTTIEGLDLDNVKILLQQSASEALPSFAMRCHQPQ